MPFISSALDAIICRFLDAIYVDRYCKRLDWGVGITNTQLPMKNVWGTIAQQYSVRQRFECVPMMDNVRKEAPL